MTKSTLRRLTHRRALTALTLFLLLASAIVYATRKSDDAPYTPGVDLEGITDTNKKDAAGAGSGIVFKDVAERSGLDFRHFSGGARSTQLPEDMGSGCAFGDYDGDGDWDLFVADTIGPLTMTPEQVRDATGGCRLYRNDGGIFTDVTVQAGFGGLKGTYMGAAWGDFDNDGFPDIVVTSYGEIHLFRNRGNGTFEDVSARSGVGGRKGFWTGAAWGDVDGDGRLDLYVCNYVDYKFDPRDSTKASKFGNASSPFTINPESYPPVPNVLFHNDRNGHFSEVAAEAGVANPEGRSLSATFADLNDDGRPDLYVANDVSEGALFVNQGNGLFADRGRDAHVADYRGSMGIAVGDANGDGALDFFVTHWIAEANAFYLNKLGATKGRVLDFEDAAERFGLGHISADDIAWGTAFLDVDGDGQLDLVVANGSTFEVPENTRKLVPMPMRLFLNRPGGFVDVASATDSDLKMPRVGRGLAIADVDGDLREEIAIVVHGGKLVLLKGAGGPRNHRIAFRVEGRTSNRSGFGARLVLESKGKKQVREIGAGSSYLSQNAPEAIFGLESATQADTLSVRWPSGATANFRDLPADRAYLLVEGEAKPRVLEDTRARTLAFWDAYGRARDAASRGHSAEAIAAYRQALTKNPRHEDSRYALGNLLAEGGDRAGAVAELEALLTIEPRAVRAHGALGDLLADPASGPVQDLAAAKRHYETAGRINGEETGWLVRLAEVALVSGDVFRAEHLLRKVLIPHPRSFQALYLLGYLAEKGGNAVEGARLFDAAFLALGPNASPAPGEGDVRKAEKPLPRRGVFAGHWDLLGAGTVRRDEAWADLNRRIERNRLVRG